MFLILCFSILKNSIIILFLRFYFHRLDFSAESGKVMNKKTEFVSSSKNNS